MQRILDNLRQNWITYGFETLVVIAGILGAFALNNWRDANADRKKAINYLEGIAFELKTDTATISSGIRMMDRFMQRKLKIMHTSDYSEISTEELCSMGSPDLRDYVITDITFSKIQDFDMFDFLKNEELVNELIRYYSIEKNHFLEAIMWDREFNMYEEKITKFEVPFEVMRTGMKTIQSEQQIREEAIRFLESPHGRNIITHFLWRRDILMDGFHDKRIEATQLLTKVQEELDRLK